MNKANSIYFFSRAYSLFLDDKTSWQIESCQKNLQIVQSFAYIMELKEGNNINAQKIIFCKDGFAKGMINEKDWIFYEHQTLRIWHHNNIPDVICELKGEETAENDYLNMWFALHPIYQTSIKKNGLPLHAALIEYKGGGYLICGAGSSGKSTCCRRLPYGKWKSLCDDEALVVKDKRGNYRVHPFPTWSDYLWKRANNTWDVQHSIPLRGIFFLKQANYDSVGIVGQAKAAALVNSSANQVCNKFCRAIENIEKNEFKVALFNNACELSKTVPVFLLYVSLEGKFWEVMEKVI